MDLCLVCDCGTFVDTLVSFRRWWNWYAISVLKCVFGHMNVWEKGMSWCARIGFEMACLRAIYATHGLGHGLSHGHPTRLCVIIVLSASFTRSKTRPTTQPCDPISNTHTSGHTGWDTTVYPNFECSRDLSYVTQSCDPCFPNFHVFPKFYILFQIDPKMFLNCI